ncbi:hypothetical protein AAH979_23615 [Plantactinospora sp. ZYX-F-223]
MTEIDIDRSFEFGFAANAMPMGPWLAPESQVGKSSSPPGDVPAGS